MTAHVARLGRVRLSRQVGLSVLEDGGPPHARRGYRHSTALTVPQARALESAAYAALKGYNWRLPASPKKHRPGKRDERALFAALARLRWAIESAVLR